jgi:hypothetical protein
LTLTLSLKGKGIKGRPELTNLPLRVIIGELHTRQVKKAAAVLKRSQHRLESLGYQGFTF